jgi:hypothetical protein
MKVTHESYECGKLPTWLDASLGRERIVCLDEVEIGANLTMLSVGADGSLSKISSSPVLGGAVSSISYNNGTALALALKINSTPSF